jgi:hypothetical protein
MFKFSFNCFYNIPIGVEIEKNQVLIYDIEITVMIRNEEQKHEEECTIYQ